MTRTAVIERLGGCCCGTWDVDRKRAKSRIKTVTKPLSTPLKQTLSFLKEDDTKKEFFAVIMDL